MLAFAYDVVLRREELCSLRSDDIDPSRRVLRIRAETTKGRRDRIVPYSAASSELLHRYLQHRRRSGGLFFSRSPAATMVNRSPSGAGRRPFLEWHGALEWNASVRTRFATSV
jgi:integrase